MTIKYTCHLIIACFLLVLAHKMIVVIIIISTITTAKVTNACGAFKNKDICYGIVVFKGIKIYC